MEEKNVSPQLSPTNSAAISPTNSAASPPTNPSTFKPSRDSLLGSALTLANKLGRGNVIQEKQYSDYFIDKDTEFLTTHRVLNIKDIPKYHGFGIMRKGSFVYVGYFFNGIPHGYGMALFENTTYVEGSWVNGELYGPARQIIGRKESFASTIKGQIEGLSVLYADAVTIGKFSEGEQLETITITQLGISKKNTIYDSDGSSKSSATFQSLGEPVKIDPETNEFINKTSCAIL